MKKRWMAVALTAILLMAVGGAIGTVSVRQESANVYDLYFVERNLRAASGGDALRAEERALSGGADSTAQQAEALMAELQNIRSTVHPHEILLVIDAMTGQDAVNVAKSFNEALGIDGVILTKLDGDTRGGAALSVRAVTGKPIKFIGTGEKLDQLETFHPSRMASRILGMGDVLSLIERAEMSLDEKKAAELERKLAKNKFDLNDLLDQFDQIERMGSLRDTIKMLPGIGSKIKDEDIDEGAFNRFRSIIYSMTVEERTKPEIINPSRKRRIAAGCGMQVEDVNRLLSQFKQMQKMVKQFGGGKGGPKMSKKMRRMMSQNPEMAQRMMGKNGGSNPFGF